jgi:hypothetical protein
MSPPKALNNVCHIYRLQTECCEVPGILIGPKEVNFINCPKILVSRAYESHENAESVFLQNISGTVFSMKIQIWKPSVNVKFNKYS